MRVECVLGERGRKRLKSPTAVDLSAGGGNKSTAFTKFYERPFTNFRFALNWHASPDST
jgi:hypothetical protein